MVALVFCHFLAFGSSVFLEIEHDDSLQQCLTMSKIRGPIWAKWLKWVKIEPRIRFLLFSQVWCISFTLDYVGWYPGTVSNH